MYRSIARPQGAAALALALLTAADAAPSRAESRWPEPIYLTVMTHMEGDVPYDTDAPLFADHVARLRWARALFDRYGAKMTVEAEKPFARANTVWGDPILMEFVSAGHGVGTHCDFDRNLVLEPEEYAELFRENKELVDGLVGAANNRGCSGAGGRSDWAAAAGLAGFSYVDGIVGLHYLAMPKAARPDPSWTDGAVGSKYFHDSVPPDLAKRIHPVMLADAADFEEDRDGVILASTGGLGAIHQLEEAGSCTSCPFEEADLEVLWEWVDLALELQERKRPAKVELHLQINVVKPVNEWLLVRFLEGVEVYVDAGLVQWATQGEFFDAFVAADPK